MANDTFQILRSSVPLLRPLDRCPGEIYVNFADGIFGVIDAAGVARDIGPLVFQTVAALAAYDAAVAPPLGVLAFAADAFYLKETGGTAPGLPGWRELALGGGGGDYDDTELRALLAAETQNRIDGDNALGSLLGTLEVVVNYNDTVLNARISSESQARVQGDTALAQRTTTLEVFRTDAQQSGANMLQNALFAFGNEPWDFLGSNGWAIEPRDIGPSQYALVTRAPGTVRANNGDYLPTPSQQLNFEVWVERAPGTVGTVVARLELANAVGQPIPALTELLDAPEGLNTRLVLTFTLPEQAGLWRLAFVSDVSVGSIDLRAPFLGLRGQDFSAEIDSLSARITDESIARLDGDTALATRTSTLEATSTSNSTAETTFDFAAYGSLEAMEKAGWYFYPPLSSGVWAFGPNGSAIGGVGLGFNLAASGDVRLLAPAIGFNQFNETYSGMWRAFRHTGGTAADAVRVGISGGWLCYDLDGDAIATDVGASSFQLGSNISLPALADITLRGFGSGVAAVGVGNNVGAAAPFLNAPGPFPIGTARIRPELFIQNVPAGVVFAITGGRFGIVTSARENRAAIADESIARVAGDTALATRSTALEARSRALESAEVPFDFGAYPDIPTIIAAGFEASPPLTDPAWFFGADGSGEGGRTLGYRSPTFGNVILYAPRVAFNPTWLETYGGRWQLFRFSDGADPAAPIGVFAGWLPYDATNQPLVPSDFGSLHNQVSSNRPLLPGEISVFGYGRGTAELGSLITGRPSPNISDPAPFRTGTTSLRPSLQLIGVPANTTIFILNGRYGIATRAAENNALVKTETTARVSADEALAQQIQQIIATEAKGTQTFFQPTAPANPEPGWMWFQDTGPGVPDNIFRWSGIAWVRIDTAESADFAAVNARITDESTARVSGDNALSQRVAITESTNVAQGNAINGNATGLVTVNARVSDETTARVTADTALAQRVSNTETTTNSNTNRLTVTEQATAAQGLKWSVRADANGRVAGIDLINGTTGPSLLSFLVDVFRIFNSANGQDEPVFTVQGGRVFIREAFIPLLGTSSLKIDDVVLDTNAQGELTIRQQGITTSLLAQNAAVRPYTFFGQGSWTVNPRNTWITAQIAGRTAQLTIINPPTATGFLEIVLVFGASNAGNSADAMGFRIQRSDGVILPQVYINCEIAETFGRNDMRTLHFFDEGVPAGQTLTYTLQVQSDDGSFVRSITLLGKLFKNASAAVGASA